MRNIKKIAIKNCGNELRGAQIKNLRAPPYLSD